MIIWINGAFGTGKTTTAAILQERLPKSEIFDPEQVGFILRPILSDNYPVSDFREWTPWRSVVAAAAASLHSYVEGPLILPQTIPEQGFFREISQVIESAGIELLHVTLIAEEHEHFRRIETDQALQQVAEGRKAAAPKFRTALPWLRNESTVIDTTHLTAEDTADSIERLIR